MGRADDTIAAIAIAPGRGGIGIVRISGPATRAIATAVLGMLPPPRQAVFRHFRDGAGESLDEGLALYFPAPNSFTGEDVLELHGHGGPVVLDMVLARTVELGARLARPGEFSERAFLSGKLDLAQAEAIADLIEAGSESAARSALRSLDGELSRQVRALTEALVQLRMYVEAAIDFPEEEVDFLADDRVRAGAKAIGSRLEELLASARQGVLLHDGMTVVIAGAPNVGKSSLLNALARVDAAIVSPVPGTTRDVLKERIHIDGMPLHIVDTAGLREATDEVETEGIRRAREQIARADRVLLVVDDTAPTHVEDGVPAFIPAALPHTLVRNKIDVSGRSPAIVGAPDATEIALSAKTGAGMELLRNHLKECAGLQPAGEGTFIARRRHLDALTRARTHVDFGVTQLQERRAGELLAEELRQAQQALGEITGEFTSDELLGRIFASFCIGK